MSLIHLPLSAIRQAVLLLGLLLAVGSLAPPALAAQAQQPQCNLPNQFDGDFFGGDSSTPDYWGMASSTPDAPGGVRGVLTAIGRPWMQLAIFAVIGTSFLYLCYYVIRGIGDMGRGWENWHGAAVALVLIGVFSAPVMMARKLCMGWFANTIVDWLGR